MDSRKNFKVLLTLPLFVSLVSCGGTSSTMATSSNSSSHASSSVAPISSSSSGKELPVDERKLTAEENAYLNLTGEDELGRKIQRLDSLKSDTRYVGLFYSMWIGQHLESQTDIYNITSLEKTPEGRAALQDPDSQLSRTGEFHFWGEPLYGYYNSRDPWVLTKHIELFINAGIDYLCIDQTNDVVYKDAIETLLNLLLDFHQQGVNIPKVCFYTNSYSGNTVDKLYSAFYQTEKYNDVWFSPNGKPLIIGITKNNNSASDQTKYNPNFDHYIKDEMIEFFDVKESEWPNGDYNENSLPWMSWEYPQKIHNGAITVPVAQHSHSRISVSYKDPECSRGYDNVTKGVNNDYRAGNSFQQMWETALNEENKVSNVLVTSFNEWMAIKQINDDGAFFVDVYDEEYSRDIEMTKEGYGDNFYLQLVQNVRNYKGNPYVEYKKNSYDIDIANGVSPIWNVIKTAYADLENDAIKRNFDGAVKGLRYTDDSARNDIKLVKVANSEDKLFFYVECKEDITSYDNSQNYMNLFLKTQETENSFLGCNYVVNRSINGNKTSIEKCLGGYSYEKVGEADIYIDGNIMQIAIPRDLIETDSNCNVEFKLADHVTDYQNALDYYTTGESMPLGRMRYGY